MSRQVAWNWLLSCMVSWPKPSKSRSRMCRVIRATRSGTTASARCCRGRRVAVTPTGGPPPQPCPPFTPLSKGTGTPGPAPYLQQGAGVHAALHPHRAAHLLLLPADLEGTRRRWDVTPLEPRGPHPTRAGGASPTPHPAGGWWVQPRHRLSRSLTTSTRTLSSGQWLSGATCQAMLSLPSGRSPRCHCTKPPNMLRQALPEPHRATSDNSPSTP